MEQQSIWSKRLIRTAAVFGLVGAGLGAHMAGSGGYQFRPIHAHILVVGWLSLFAWGVYHFPAENSLFNRMKGAAQR